MANKLKLKNYTTTIPAERSISEIKKILVSFGAEASMEEYSPDGKVRVIQFRLKNEIYKLPANIKGVQNVLFGEKRGYAGRDSMKNREERAYRVAWRIIKDWIHSQLSLIESGQAQAQEIFLPYAYDGKSKKTLFQLYQEHKLLPQHTGVQEEG